MKGATKQRKNNQSNNNGNKQLLCSMVVGTGGLEEGRLWRELGEVCALELLLAPVLSVLNREPGCDYHL